MSQCAGWGHSQDHSEGLLTLRSTVEGLLVCRILGDTMEAASLERPAQLWSAPSLSGGGAYDLRVGPMTVITFCPLKVS